MNAPSSDHSFSEYGPWFDSRNSEILIIDGPGDTTVRPAPEHLLPFLRAERERLLRLQQSSQQPPPPDKSPEDAGGNRSENG